MENVNTRMTKYDTPIKQAIQHLQGGLDLEVLRRYCEEHGEKRTFL